MKVMTLFPTIRNKRIRDIFDRFGRGEISAEEWAGLLLEDAEMRNDTIKRSTSTVPSEFRKIEEWLVAQNVQAFTAHQYVRRLQFLDREGLLSDPAGLLDKVKDGFKLPNSEQCKAALKWYIRYLKL